MSNPLPDESVLAMAPIYADRFHLIVGADGITRLALGIGIDEHRNKYHSAFAITNATLESLYKTLGELLARVAAQERNGKKVS